MSGSQVTVPLQIMCQLMTVGLVTQNMTVSLSPKRAMVGTNDTQDLPCNYVEFPEFGVAYKRSTGKLNHNEARKSCLNEGGQLAVIDSREKVDKVTNHFAISTGWVGVGMGSFYETSEWMTIDGKYPQNLPWKSGEPNRGFKCAYLSETDPGLMNLDCNNSYFYFCEIALPRN